MGGFRTGLDDWENREYRHPNKGSSITVAFGLYFIEEPATCFGLRSRHREQRVKNTREKAFLYSAVLTF